MMGLAHGKVTEHPARLALAKEMLKVLYNSYVCFAVVFLQYCYSINFMFHRQWRIIQKWKEHQIVA